MAATIATGYQHLEPRPGSNYRQLFLKGRRIRAAVVHEAVHGPDPYTPEEFATNYEVPIEAVREALDDAERHMELIEAERDREAADVRRRGLDRIDVIELDHSHFHQRPVRIDRAPPRHG